MAETAFQVLYRDEWIAGFERSQAKLRNAVATEAMVTGRQATFLVANSGREAVTRGSNGLIPATADDLTQTTVTLKEKHDLSQKTNFNIFAGQSDQRAIMQKLTRNVINRDVDNEIISALNGATNVITGGTATSMTMDLALTAAAELAEAHVEMDDGGLFAAVTPRAWGWLMKEESFASQDYVSSRPMEEGFVEMKRWMGVTWIRHNGLPGAGTADATMFIWHRDAVGHAYASSDIQSLVGYNEEQDYSWARTTLYHGALLIQNAGVVAIEHNDTTAYAA